METVLPVKESLSYTSYFTFLPVINETYELFDRCTLDLYTLTMGFGVVLSVMTLVVCLFFSFPLFFTLSSFFLTIVCIVGTYCAIENRQLEAMSEQLDDFKEENKSLKSTREKLALQVTNLETQTQKLDVTIQALEVQKAVYSNQIQTLKEQIDDFKNASELQKQEHEKLLETRKELAKTTKELQVVEKLLTERCVELATTEKNLKLVTQQFKDILSDSKQANTEHRSLVDEQKTTFNLFREAISPPGSPQKKPSLIRLDN